MHGLALCAVMVCSCRKSVEEPAPAPTEGQAVTVRRDTPAKAATATATTPTTPGPNPAAAATEPSAAAVEAPQQSSVIQRRGPDPGWSPLSLQDELPICLFSSLEARAQAPYLKDVKPQKLRADSPITFGVYGPGCLNEACDDRPTLQCWVELPGSNTIIVHSRFSSFHKDGAQCTEDCMDLDTACWSLDPLKAGTYTVQHGTKRYKVKLPSKVSDPCFGSK